MRVEPWWLVLCRSCVLLEPRRARASSEHAATARLAMGCIWLLADFMKVVKPEREPQPPIRIYNNTLSHKRGIMQSVQVLCERDATPTYGKPKLTPNTPRFDPPRADSLAARLIRATLAIERRGLGTGGEQEENRGLRRRGL